MITRNGIYNNIDESNYTLVIDDVMYFFSSKLYMRKFKERYEMERSILNYSLSKKYNAKINANILSDLILYAKIEKRGFKIVINGRIYKCLKNINLHLEHQI